MILENNGRCLLKNLSPLQEKDTFAIYDEPRCRGTDLKLHSEAVALLTVGKSMVKDKFMQAAGRMRKLEQGGQTLIIVGHCTVFNEIRLQQKKSAVGSSSKMSQCTSSPLSRKIDVQDVLSWIMFNTIESNCVGLGSWSDQGIFFATESKPEHGVLDEKKELDDFYGSPTTEVSIAEVAVSSKNFHTKRTKSGCEKNDMINKILHQAKFLGNSYAVRKNATDEECERELEREVEEEEVEELKLPQMKPRNEEEWDVSKVFCVDSVNGLKELCAPISLKDVISIYLSPFYSSLKHVDWSSKVFCTGNFLKTITKEGPLDHYMKVPDAMLCFTNGEILLVSDREADMVLDYILGRKCCPNNCVKFCHMAFESDAELPLSFNGTSLSISSKINISKMLFEKQISTKDACSLKLFNGETSFPGNQMVTLKKMLSCAKLTVDKGNFLVSQASGEPNKLVQLRGKHPFYDRSHIEAICIELSCEAENTE